MTKTIFPSHKIKAAFHSHKIIEVDGLGRKVMIKDTTTNRVGEVVEDESFFMQSTERVCIRLPREIEPQFMKYLFNFDPNKYFPSQKGVPAFSCAKILQINEDQTNVIVKDTTSDILGQSVEDEQVFLQSAERVAIVRSFTRDGYPTKQYVYNFDPHLTKESVY